MSLAAQDLTPLATWRHFTGGTTLGDSGCITTAENCPARAFTALTLPFPLPLTRPALSLLSVALPSQSLPTTKASLGSWIVSKELTMHPKPSLTHVLFSQAARSAFAALSFSVTCTLNGTTPLTMLLGIMGFDKRNPETALVENSVKHGKSGCAQLKVEMMFAWCPEPTGLSGLTTSKQPLSISGLRW